MTSEIEVAESSFQALRTDTGRPCKLAMQELRLSGRLLPVGARLVVEHVFRSSERKPVEVIYAFALPRDAALRRFCIIGTDFRVTSDLKPVAEAAKDYEDAIERGRLAGLVREYRDGLVNLTVGNIRPAETVTVRLELVAGVESRDDGFRFRFPFTLAPTYHAQARAIAARPGTGEMELPEDLFGDVVLPPWHTDAGALHRVGFDLSVALPGSEAEVSSASHPIRVALADGRNARVSLAVDGDLPNRDLILDVRASSRGAGHEPVVLCGLGTDGRGRIAAVIPSGAFAGTDEQPPAHIVFVIDRSGSMEGPAMRQALKSVEACLGALGAGDRFGIVAFDDQVAALDSALHEATSDRRQEAARFLAPIGARGGTQLLPALQRAARILGGAPGDVLLLTDGQVSGTEDIITPMRASGVRIHCLGIGSASQDRFLALLARESGGTSRFLSPRERVDVAALELFAGIRRPAAMGVRAEIAGLQDAQLMPQPASTVYGGTPLAVLGVAGQGGSGELVISWDAREARKSLALPLRIDAQTDGETLRLLHGARLITDLEAQFDSGDGDGDDRLGKRRMARIEHALETIGREYGLANRRLALVAAVQRAGDSAGEVPHTQVVPVGLPEGVAFGAYFDADPKGAWGVMHQMDASPPPPIECGPTFAPPRRQTRKSQRRAAGPRELRSSLPSPVRRSAFEHRRDPSSIALALELAARVATDGGMNAATPADRILATVLALLAFASEGRAVEGEVPGRPRGGPFAPHAARLTAFLEAADLSPFSSEQQQWIRRIVEALGAGRPPQVAWADLARGFLEGGAIDRHQIWDLLREAAAQ